jgi:hypothetical protein
MDAPEPRLSEMRNSSERPYPRTAGEEVSPCSLVETDILETIMGCTMLQYKCV